MSSRTASVMYFRGLWKPVHYRVRDMLQLRHGKRSSVGGHDMRCSPSLVLQWYEL